MAQRITLVDDVDGSERGNVQTRHITIGEMSWEIDLSDTNFRKMLSDIAGWLDKARQVGVPEAPPAHKRKRDVSPDEAERNAEIRAWAMRNGHKVSTRGRIPATIITAFEDEARKPHLVSVSPESKLGTVEQQ